MFNCRRRLPARLWRGSFSVVFTLSVLAGAALLSLPLATAQRAVAVTQATISTIAGGGFGANAQVRQAPMELPVALALDPQGRGFYVVDELEGSSLLRFVNTSANPVTLAGAVVLPNNINLVAGGGLRSEDVLPARDVDLAKVTGLAVDPTGNAVLLTIPAFNLLRVVNVGTQNVMLGGRDFAPGTASVLATPEFAELRSAVIHPVSREIYFIAGAVVHRLNGNGMITPFAGGGSPRTGNGDGGPAQQARLVNPRGLAFDTNANLLIAEGGNPRSENPDGAVRRVISNGTISTLAGGLDFPIGLTVAPNGNVYVALGNQQQLLSIAPNGSRSVAAGTATGLACDQNSRPNCGDGGAANQANLNLPDSASAETLVLAADSRGIYLPDYRYGRVRFINLSGSSAVIAGTTINPLQINTIVGSGLEMPYDGLPATNAVLSEPTGIAVNAAGNLFIADTRDNRLRFVNRGTQPITLFVTTPSAVTVQPGQIVTLNKNAGDAAPDERISVTTFNSPQGLLATERGLFIVDSQAGSLIKIPPTSITGRRSGLLRFLNTSSQDVVFFPNGGTARVVVPPGQIRDLAGVRTPDNPQILGDGLTADLVAFFPTDVALDSAGNIYLADQGNHRIRRIDANNAVVSTVYGDGMTTRLNRPTGITFDGAGRLLIADTRNNRVLRQIAPGTDVYAVIADQTKNVRMPRDLAVDGAGKIFITNAGTHQVLDLLANDNQLGTTSVVAGNGAQGFSGDDGPAEQARLYFPQIGTAVNDIQLTANILILSNGDILFTDTGNNRVRLLKRVAEPTVTSISAASFVGTEIASESIVAAFGVNLATTVEVANSLPLPTTLAGTKVKVKDSGGTERDAPLFFVAPSQINYLVPSGTLSGPASLTVTSGDGATSRGTLTIASVAPGLFAANANGRGVAAAVALRVKADGAQSFEAIARFDSAQNVSVPVPLDLGPEGDQVFLLLFGTGFRFRSGLSAVTVRIGDADAEVSFAGATDLAGLDQLNAKVPRSLIGRGVVDIVLTVDGKAANVLTMQTK
jgi:uncharacterized protein (TIGR03437 family)